MLVDTVQVYTVYCKEECPCENHLEGVYVCGCVQIWKLCPISCVSLELTKMYLEISSL